MYSVETSREPVIFHVASLHQGYQESGILKAVEQVRSQVACLFVDFGW